MAGQGAAARYTHYGYTHSLWLYLQAKELQLALAKARQRLVCRGGGDGRQEPGGAEQGGEEEEGGEEEGSGEPGAAGVEAHVTAGALEDAEVAEMGSVLRLLLRSQALWTSPQCRAVQTAMVALQPLACGGALAVELRAAAREQRELTNPASAGNCTGEALRARCLDRLRHSQCSHREPSHSEYSYSHSEYSHSEYSHSEYSYGKRLPR